MKMKTIAEAEAAGFTVDVHGAGRPYAYMGERFRPFAKVNCLTALEADLLLTMRNIVAFSGGSQTLDADARGIKLMAEAAIARAENCSGNLHDRVCFTERSIDGTDRPTTTGEDHETDQHYQTS